jgi:hypothetical protein
VSSSVPQHFLPPRQDDTASLISPFLQFSSQSESADPFAGPRPVDARSNRGSPAAPPETSRSPSFADNNAPAAFPIAPEIRQPEVHQFTLSWSEGSGGVSKAACFLRGGCMPVRLSFAVSRCLRQQEPALDAWQLPGGESEQHLAVSAFLVPNCAVLPR